MSEFFKAWKKKIGCVTLLMALVFIVGWVRSHEYMDSYVFGYGLRNWNEGRVKPTIYRRPDALVLVIVTHDFEWKWQTGRLNSFERASTPRKSS